MAQRPVAQSPVAQRPYFAYSGAYLCSYLSAPNMVEWGVPEKILQNAVQTQCLGLKMICAGEILDESR